jgi:hypothetical protein
MTEQLKEINLKIKQLNTDSSITRDSLIRTTRATMKNFEDYGQLYLGGTAMIASDMISFIESDLQYFALGVLGDVHNYFRCNLQKYSMGGHAFNLQRTYCFSGYWIFRVNGLEGNSRLF